jgi:hypothetical protein
MRKKTTKSVTCPNGHRIRLEMVEATPNLIQSIECPTCKTNLIVFAGELLAVLAENRGDE